MPADTTATEYPVLRLVESYPYIHHKGFILWADNWFTSIKLVSRVSRLGIDSGGTCNLNRMKNCFTVLDR